MEEGGFPCKTALTNNHQGCFGSDQSLKPYEKSGASCLVLTKLRLSLRMPMFAERNTMFIDVKKVSTIQTLQGYSVLINNNAGFVIGAFDPPSGEETASRNSPLIRGEN